MHKRRVLLLLVIGIVLSILGLGGRYLDNSSSNFFEQNNLIRLHVIANSNTITDQQLKLKVRDVILTEITPEFESLTDVNQAKWLINKNLKIIQDLVEREIKRRGYDYPVKVELGEFNFPTKQYGKIIFPAGNYEALKVVIGAGQGNNWWCVLFPPLCFVDITKKIAVENSEVKDEQLAGQGEIQIEYRLKIREIFSKRNG